MKVLSLFDGISCGRLALERTGIPVDAYVAYEIEESAIKISKKNWPDIKHEGDVTKADFTRYQDFDLLIGGSPCQSLSIMQAHKRQNGEPNSDDYTYLASTWAVPELKINGKKKPCYKMQSETPGWDYNTKWPESALKILKGE